MFLLSNIIGAFAVTFWVLSIQRKEKKNILSFQIIANILYGIQYFLIGVYPAALMNFISTFRASAYYKYERKNKEIPKCFLYLFLGLIIIFGVLTYNGYLSLIPIVITLFYTYSSWHKNLSWIRYVFLIAAIVWIFYNIIVGAYVAVIGNIFEIVSGLTSIIRFKKR